MKHYMKKEDIIKLMKGTIYNESITITNFYTQIITALKQINKTKSSKGKSNKNTGNTRV